MNIKNQTIIASMVLICSTTLSTEGMARSFKAKYYKECYAQVKEIEPLLKEKGGIGGSAKKLKKAGGLFGSVAGLAGLGGVASKAYQISSAIDKVNKYSTIIGNVSAYTSQMRQDHPDANDRFGAYGDQMTKEAQDLDKVQRAIGQSQDCYNTAYNALAVQVENKEIKKRKAKKYLKEIQKGSRSAGDKLLVTMKRLNTNINSFDQTFSKESNSLGLGFGSGGGSFGALSKLASFGGIKPVGKAAVYTGLAGNLASQAVNAAAPVQTESERAAQQMLPGLQRAGLSSRKYLALYKAVTERVESQKMLERKVKKRPW